MNINTTDTYNLNNLLYPDTIDLNGMVISKKIIENFLMNPKGDLNTKYDDNGNTALMFTAYFDYHELARALIEAKANPDIQNNFGETALRIAALSHNTNVVHELINAKANVNLVDHGGSSPLDTMIGNAFLASIVRPSENSVSSAFAEMIKSKNLLIISLLLNAGAIIQFPRHLFKFLMTCDQRDPDVLSSLECLYKQLNTSIMSAIPEGKPINIGFFHEIRIYLEQLKKLTEIHHEEIINTIDRATDKKIVPDLVKIIANYDAPLQDRITFFKPEEINSLLPKPEEHKETAPLEPIEPKAEKSKCSVM